MRFVLAVAGVLLLPASASAQNFSGTYSLPGGNVPITLTLQQDGQGRIAGTLSGQTAFQILAQVQGPMFQGFASNAQGRIYIGGQLDPSGSLQLVMAEVDANGQPQQQTARQILAVRTATGGTGGTGGMAGRGGAGGRGNAGGKPGAGAMAPTSAGQPNPMATQPGQGAQGGIAATPQDRQIVQLLLRSAWCYFSYSQTSGTTHTERVVYRQDGTGNQTTGGETYNSGPNGTVSGQSQGGTLFRWRVQNGVLLATSDGVQWGQYPLQITRNSSGYPIITAAGKEYSMCN